MELKAAMKKDDEGDNKAEDKKESKTDASSKPGQVLSKGKPAPAVATQAPPAPSTPQPASVANPFKKPDFASRENKQLYEHKKEEKN